MDIHPLYIWLRKKGLKQKEFAVKAGVNAGSLSMLMRHPDKRYRMTLLLASKIVKATDGEIGYDDLLCVIGDK